MERQVSKTSIGDKTFAFEGQAKTLGKPGSMPNNLAFFTTWTPGAVNGANLNIVSFQLPFDCLLSKVYATIVGATLAGVNVPINRFTLSIRGAVTPTNLFSTPPTYDASTGTTTFFNYASTLQFIDVEYKNPMFVSAGQNLLINYGFINNAVLGATDVVAGNTYLFFNKV